MNKDNDYFNALKIISKTNSPKLFFEIIKDKTIISRIKNTLDSIDSIFSICKKCFYICENKICYFCSDNKRNHKLICVVSSLYDAYKIYNTDYDGLIHVVSDVVNINDDKNNCVDVLYERSKTINEVILAMSITFEGEIISNYLKSKLSPSVKRVSRIAQGIPFGGSLNYADYETLSSSLLNRKKIK